jgi:peroxiredoxin
MRKPITALLALLFLSILADSAFAGKKSLTPLGDNQEAADFVLEDIEGVSRRLSDYRGKVLVVNFWATWCSACRQEMPALTRANDWLKRFGGEVISVNVGEGKEQIVAFLKKYPVNFPVLMDPETATATAWKLKGLPATFIIDPNGVLAYRAYGAREWDSPEILVPIRALGMSR